ncbi:MAG TPA: hypothetical protein VJQ55_14880 [Candidatus Binatia bacterium]|nr:hypothetical protein [Candidatus Binatia bacterium]
MFAKPNDLFEQKTLLLTNTYFCWIYWRHLRLELETALRRDIPVIPILVRRAGVPTEQDYPSH